MDLTKTPIDINHVLLLLLLLLLYRNVQHGDFGKTMESLRKIDAKINYENVVSDINSSLPARFIYCVVIKDVSQFLYFLVYAYHRTDGSLAHIVHVYFTFLRACFGRAIMFMCVI